MASLLLIEDDQPLRAAMARILRSAGYRVLEAANGADGLALMARHAPDLIITDINMPEMDGIEVMNRIRDSESGIPVLAVSGGGRISKTVLLDDILLLGAAGALEKPFDPEGLLAAVSQALPARTEADHDS